MVAVELGRGRRLNKVSARPQMLWAQRGGGGWATPPSRLGSGPLPWLYGGLAVRILVGGATSPAHEGYWPCLHFLNLAA